jgi:hypothetical protein
MTMLNHLILAAIWILFLIALSPFLLLVFLCAISCKTVEKFNGKQSPRWPIRKAPSGAKPPFPSLNSSHSQLSTIPQLSTLVLSLSNPWDWSTFAGMALYFVSVLPAFLLPIDWQEVRTNGIFCKSVRNGCLFFLAYLLLLNLIYFVAWRDVMATNYGN